MDSWRFEIHNEHQRHLNFKIVFLKSWCLKIVLGGSGGCDHHQNVAGNENERSQPFLLLLKIRTVFHAVSQDLLKLRVDITKFRLEEYWRETKDTDDVLSSIRERLELLNPDIRILYDLISSNSSPATTTTFVNGLSHATVTENIRLLIFHIENLQTHEFQEAYPQNKDHESIKASLFFLSNFLSFTSKRSSEQLGKLTDLVNHAESVVRNISCLLYLCPFQITDPIQLNDWRTQFSPELRNFSPAKAVTREVYIKALEASKSSLPDSNAAADESDFEFLESLGDSIVELSETNLSFIATNRDHILSLHKDLQILTICFAMSDSSTSYTDRYVPESAELDQINHIFNYFQQHISAIIIDMSCLIYALYDNEQNIDRRANELKLAVTALQDTMETAQANARKAYEPYIPKSWRMKTKFRNTDAKGIILSLTRIWEKSNTYASKKMRFMSYYPFRLRKYVFSAFQEEIQSLIGTFRNSIAKHYLDDAELQIIHDDIKSKTEYLFSSDWRVFWGTTLMSFLLIEDIKKIKNVFEDLPSQIMPESKVNNTSVNVGVGEIEPHESSLDFLCPQEDEIKAHRLKEAFLEVFLWCKGKKHIEDGDLEVLLASICCSGSSSTDQELQRLFSGSNFQMSPQKVCFLLPMNMDCLFSIFISCFGDQGISDDDVEALMENLKALIQNIEVLLKCNNEMVDPMKKELEATEKSLRYLRNFIGFTSKSCGELRELKDLLIHSEFLACKLSFLLHFCCDIEKMRNYHVVNEIKMHLSSDLQKLSLAGPGVRDICIKSLEALKSTKAISDSADLEHVLGFLDSLREDALNLFNNELSHAANKNKDQVLSLQEELKFLTTFFTAGKSLEGQSENKQISNSVIECIKAVLIDIGCSIYSLNNDMDHENIASMLSKKVPFLVANFVAAKASIREIYNSFVPKPLWSDFPRTNGQGFVNELLRKLDELSSTKDGLVSPLKHNIEIVKEELLDLMEYFVETGTNSEELQIQWNSFLDTAYQTEYVIDSFLAEDFHLYRCKLGLFNVIECIKRIKKVIKTVEIKKTDETSVHKSSCLPTQVLLEESDIPRQNVVCGSRGRQADEKRATELLIFKEEAESIIEKLTNGLEKLTVISIVGMGGIGKTTLADSVFKHSSVTPCFQVKARCTVSQVHDKRRLLIEILEQLGKSCSENDEELDRQLYQSLRGRRYLILVDDIWEIEPWKDLRASFPDDSNGSRIIFTSRSHDIAEQTGLESNVYQLLPLPEEKSWELFQLKLFGRQSSPTELHSGVGRKIAANCRGLPLSIDLVAGFLRGKESGEWKNVAECLMTILLEDPEGRCQGVLQLSYKNLPDDMKPCFLYFAAFPEDKNVSTETLISLWIAEGFVRKEEGGQSRRLENVANDILEKLINRSLVTVSRKTPSGEVTATRVHDLLHEFAIAKAKEENFMLRADGKAVTHVGIHPDQQRDPYRLCIYPENWESFLRSNPNGPRTRSLVCYYAPFVNNNVSLILNTFTLLRVLYIPGNYSGPYPPEMFRLIHLRVLVIGGSSDSNVSSIMAKIHKFRNLECFSMSQTRQQSVHLLLDKICRMERLRSFYFEGNISFKYRSEKIWEISPMFKRLQSIYQLKVSYEEDIEMILKLMPNLVELEAVFYSPSEEKHQFPKLEFLDKLEYLRVAHEGQYCFSTGMLDEIRFPPYLKTLILSNFWLPWSEIWKLGDLKSLETLELQYGAFEGPTWDMIDGQFPNLKHLSLYGLNIKEWNASSDHLWRLQMLLVAGCEELEELPTCLAEIETLQRIKIVQCKDSVEISAMRIKEEQEETRDEELDVEIIQDSWEM